MTKRNDLSVQSENTQNLWRFIKFTLFSASAGIVQVVSFTLLNEMTKLPYWPCYLVALVLSVIYNFTINRRFTFRSDVNYAKAMLKILGYYAVFTPLSTWAGDRLSLLGVNEYIVLAGTMLINFITEFLFSHYVVYRNTINSIDYGMEPENTDCSRIPADEDII